MSKVSQFDNSTLELYYSNLNYLFNFLQPHLDVNVEILKDEDEEEYKKLLTTSVINADTTKKFPQIMKEHQGTIPKKDTCLDIVSIVSIYEYYLFILFLFKATEQLI